MNNHILYKALVKYGLYFLALLTNMVGIDQPSVDKSQAERG